MDPTTRTTAATRLRESGFAFLGLRDWNTWLGPDAQALPALADTWNGLPPDRYLKDGGHYRFRRHASAVYERGRDTLQRVPHRPHYQPTTYNALHGGILRWFEPITDAVWQMPAFPRLLAELARLFTAVRRTERWYIEAHQFRIDARGEVGKPTPEGAHRDGVDFVALALVDRRDVEGGVTSLYDDAGTRLAQTTLGEPWTLMLLDDLRVVHETTPVRGIGPDAHRDTLVLTYRRDGFMAPEAAGA